MHIFVHQGKPCVNIIDCMSTPSCIVNSSAETIFLKLKTGKINRSNKHVKGHPKISKLIESRK